MIYLTTQGIDETIKHSVCTLYVNVILNVYVYPDSEVNGANMGLTWDLLAPGGPHVGSMNLGRLRDVVVLIKSNLDSCNWC